jgi:hypothetical protein
MEDWRTMMQVAEYRRDDLMRRARADRLIGELGPTAQQGARWRAASLSGQLLSLTAIGVIAFVAMTDAGLM